jgi:hypothetical protein
MQREEDYGFISKNIDIWHGDFPFKEGDQFPPEKLQERADLSYTNRLLMRGDYQEVFGYMLSSIPELDPVYGLQIKDIISNLPYFKTTVDAYISLCCGTPPLIDTPDNVDIEMSNIIGNSNMNAVIESMFKSLFADPIDAYRLTVNKKNKPVIQQIPVKNFIVYNSEDDIFSICCVLVFNVINDKVEFIEYWDNGKIVKRVFKYSNGILGKQIEDKIETIAYNGVHAESPIVVVKHNPETINDTYGIDQLSYWVAPIIAICRSLSNLLRLNERCREIIRLIPESAINVNPINSASYFMNRGVITYSDNLDQNRIPKIEYLIPQIKDNVEACIQTIDKNMKLLSSASQLSPVWFDFEKMGSNLSAKSLKAAMLPTIINAERISNNMTDYIKEIVRKLGLFYNIKLNKADINVNWFTGVDDEETTTELIHSRIENKTMTIEDGIAKLDRVSRRQAREITAKIIGQQELLNSQRDISDQQVTSWDEPTFTHDETNKVNSKPSNSNNNQGISSNVIPDVAMPIIPSDSE